MPPVAVARRALLGAGWALGVALAALPAVAQPYGQPIYPGYQGYVANDDGSVTMVFQYFSHGRDPVALPVGEGNRFSGVADRMQPTVFLPGNHEDVCVIVMESREAAQQLRWYIGFPGAEVGTSVDPLNQEYMLTERARDEAQRDLDVSSAPRGVCVDKPPGVVANRLRRFSEDDGAMAEVEEAKATVGKAVTLNGQAHDEGLPRGGSLVVSWRQLSGPSAASFDDPASAHTRVTFDAAGTYELEIRASDGASESADRLRFVVRGED